MTQQSSSNVYLFYGEDDFSLRQKVDHWKAEFAKKYSASSVYEIDGADVPDITLVQQLEQILSPSLFSSKKLIIAKDCLPMKASQTELSELFFRFASSMPSDFFLILRQSKKVDRRLSFSKQFLPLIKTMEFPLPHGAQLNQWIKARAQKLSVSISDKAADKLAIYLGRDFFEEKRAGGKVIERKEMFDLWQVASELEKLACFSSNIQEGDVEKLVSAKVPENVFALTDELVRKNRAGSFRALENLLSGQNVDEKSAMIKIIGLLSEQIRSFIVVGQMAGQGMDNDQIAESLGWSSGRVFITTKNLQGLDLAKLKQMLRHLLSIDYRLKSTDENPKLMVDMFIERATA